MNWVEGEYVKTSCVVKLFGIQVGIGVTCLFKIETILRRGRILIRHYYRELPPWIRFYLLLISELRKEKG